MTQKRAVCLNCIDGRVQLPVINYIKDSYQFDYVDMITEPGMDGYLANPDNPIEGINNKVRISIEKNNGSTIFVVGHNDCKANTTDESNHKIHIQGSIDRLKIVFTGIDIIGLWVDQNWQVNSLAG